MTTTTTTNTTTLDAFIADKTSSRGGASTAGHHFIQAYNQNKWGFYLRYVRGLRPIHTKPALVFGGAIHDAKEAFYVFNSPDAMATVFREVMAARKNEYEHAALWQDDLERGPKMLYVWANTFAEDDATTYDIVEVEGQHTFPLANGLPVTVRWDLLARRRDNGRLYIFDTKTTGYSVRKSYDAVAGQDQATMYLLGASKIYPDEHIAGLIPDIMYKRQSVIKAERPGTVLRSKRELIEYEQELIGLHMELTQKIIALEEGFPFPHMLFPRNGKDDTYFGSEWPNLYRVGLPNDPYHAPPGYTVDEALINNGPYGNPALRANADYNKTLNVIEMLMEGAKE